MVECDRPRRWAAAFSDPATRTTATTTTSRWDPYLHKYVIDKMAVPERCRSSGEKVSEQAGPRSRVALRAVSNLAQDLALRPKVGLTAYGQSDRLVH